MAVEVEMKAIATHSDARNTPSALSAGRRLSNSHLPSFHSIGKFDHGDASQPLPFTSLACQNYALHSRQVLSQDIR
jgi:hypothetical protein